MMTVPAHDAYSRALMSERPDEALRSVASEMLRDGMDRYELIEHFEQLREELRAAHRIDDETVVLDVMDDLTGFTSPHMHL